MTRTTAAIIALLSLAAVVPLGSQPAGAPRTSPSGNGRFSFALIGDMPYGPEGDAKFPNVITDINADRTLSFVVHDGDFKNGSSLCSDAVFQNRLDLFNQFAHPFIYVPGDNEWTDCHRANTGSYDPLERLALLRTMFYPTDETLGRRTFTLERQSPGYPEHVRWMVHGVLFAGLHVVGSNNNLGRTPAADAEYAERNAASLAWLHESFDVAESAGARAVMIIIQANLNLELPASDPRRSGFNDFIRAIEAETIGFGRPVVLTHGDSHYFRIDKPLVGRVSGRRVENFTRVETFGENDNHWLHVSVEPGSPNVFVFDERIVAANLVQQ
jgi:hypothetical protein